MKNLSMLLVFLLLNGAGLALAQDDDTASTETATGIDIIFALDVSSSMSYPVNRNNHVERDRALRYVYGITGDFETAPTDPNNLRFEAVRFMFDWLLDFAQQERTLDINVNAVTFDTQIQPLLTGWVNLNTFDPTNPETASALTFANPNPTLAEHNSDFILLYNYLAGLESNRPTTDSNRKKVIVIVTDSLPCNARPESGISLTGADGTVVRDNNCGTRGTITNHLKQVNMDASNELRDVEKYLFIVPPGNGDPALIEQVRTVYQTFDPNWQETVGDNITYLDAIDRLPSALFSTMLLEMADVLNLREVSDSATFKRIGIEPVTSTFEVPPYQDSMQVMVFATSAESNISQPAFEHNGTEIAPEEAFDSSTELINRLDFALPRPGEWQVRTEAENLNVWVSFVAGKGELSFATPEGQQYEAFEVRYQVLDLEGNPIPLENDYPLQFDLTISGTGTSHTFTTLEMQDDAYVGRYLPREGGAYTLRGDVTPQPAWMQPGINYDYLNPTASARLSVAPLEWRVLLGSETQQTSIRNGILQISRRDPVPLTVQLVNETDEAVDLPTGIVATLEFVTPEGVENACPEQRTVTLQKTQPTLLVPPASILFPEAGECQLALNITLASELPPVSGAEETIYTSGNIGRVRADQTLRLNVVMYDSEDKPITAGGSEESVTYEMIDRQTQPIWEGGTSVIWESESKTITLAFLDEDGKPVDPQFEGITAAVSTSNPETDSRAIPIPFTVSITQGESANLAQEKAITVQKSPQVGLYTVTLRDLEPGEYVLQVSLLPDSPTLSRQYEYQQDLLAGLVEGQNPTFSATVVVKENPLIRLQRLGAIALSMLFVGSVIGLSGRSWYRRTAPLSGRLSIYRLAHKHKDPSAAEEVWYGDLPANVNRFNFPKRRLPLFDPPVKYMEAATRLDRALAKRHGAYVVVRVKDERREIKVEAEQWPEIPIYSDETDSYFLVKDWAGSGVSNLNL